MTKIRAVRYHDIAAGHRVYGHEGKCAGLHGHGYRIHFHCEAPKLDHLGRVVDFSVIKERLCLWIEEHWDHKTLLWHRDPLIKRFNNTDDAARHSIVITEFNPTAENIAQNLLEKVGPTVLEGTGVRLVKVVVEETPKCHATAEVDDG